MAKYFLARVDWALDFKDVRTFENVTAQYNYIKKVSSEIKTHNGFINKPRVNDMYNRDVLSLDFPFLTVQNYNYIAYDNEQGLGWEYAFIDVLTVDAIGTTKIKLNYDVWQNNHLKIGMNKCHVEREHVQRHSLVAGDLLKPQPYYVSDLGVSNTYADYRRPLKTVNRDNTELLYLCIPYTFPASYDIATHGDFKPGNHFYSPIEKINYAFIPFNPNNFSDNVGFHVSHLQELLASDIWDNPRALNMYITPYAPFDILREETFISTVFYEFKLNDEVIQLTCLTSTLENPVYKHEIKVPLPADCGYIPKSAINSAEASNIYFETKLLSSPYFTIKVAYDNAVIEQGWADLSIYYSKNVGSYIKVFIEVGCTVDGAVIMFTVDTVETGQMDSISQSVKISKNIPLVSDKFIDYIFNNRASFNTGVRNQIVETVAQTALTIATGAMGGGDAAAFAGGTAISSAGGIARTMNERQDMKQAPKQVRGSAIDSIELFGSIIPGYVCVYIVRPRIEELRSIYDYYNRYGYKVNRVKVPFTSNRKWFNYVKTYDFTCSGVQDMTEYLGLKNIFNSGVTIWHVWGDGTTGNDFVFAPVGDYSKENQETVRTITNPSIDETDDDYPTGTSISGSGSGKNVAEKGALVIPNVPLPTSFITTDASQGLKCVVDTVTTTARRKSDCMIGFYAATGYALGTSIIVKGIKNGVIKYVSTDYKNPNMYDIGQTVVIDYGSFNLHIFTNQFYTQPSASVGCIYLNNVRITPSSVGIEINTTSIFKLYGQYAYLAFEVNGNFFDGRLLGTIPALSTPYDFRYNIIEASNTTRITPPLDIFEYDYVSKNRVGDSVSPFSALNNSIFVTKGSNVYLRRELYTKHAGSDFEVFVYYTAAPYYRLTIKVTDGGNHIEHHIFGYDDKTTKELIKPVTLTITDPTTYTVSSNWSSDILIGTINCNYIMNCCTENSLSYLLHLPYNLYFSELNTIESKSKYLPLWNYEAKMVNQETTINSIGFMTPFKNKKFPIVKDFGEGVGGALEHAMVFKLSGTTQICAIGGGDVLNVIRDSTNPEHSTTPYGNHVQMSHNTYDGAYFEAVYGSLSNIEVAKEDSKDKGEQIAYAGKELLGLDMPGNFIFELRRDGVPVDPKLYIKEW